MEKALTKLGSFTISRKAKQDLSAIGDDISVSTRRHLSSSVFTFQSLAPASRPVRWICCLRYYLVLGKLRWEI